VLTDVGGVADGVDPAVGVAPRDGFDQFPRECDLPGASGPPQSGEDR
jgi:hypothetical protein